MSFYGSPPGWNPGKFGTPGEEEEEEEEQGQSHVLPADDNSYLISPPDSSSQNLDVSTSDLLAPEPMGIESPPKPHSLLYKVVLMTILILSGSAMTLCLKAQDLTCVKHCSVGEESGEEGEEPHFFHQPFIQLFHLGLGQVLSGAFTPLFQQKGDTNLRPITFRQFAPQAALASLFDVCAEVLVILGLSFTPASITEMLKTTMVVFVGLLSLYFFPGFSINWKQWVASVVMLAGSLLVILQGFLTGNQSSNAAAEIGGAFLVIGAQLFYGLEFVVEEKLIDHSKLKGLHVNKAQLVFTLGLLSILASLVLQMPWTAITSSFPELGEELLVYFNSPRLYASGIGVSIGVMGFDLAGLGISEAMGSDRRAISVAAFQVAIVWTISIIVGWEEFLILSLVGFLLILASGAVYVFTSKTKSEPHQRRKKKSKTKVEVENKQLQEPLLESSA